MVEIIPMGGVLCFGQALWSMSTAPDVFEVTHNCYQSFSDCVIYFSVLFVHSHSLSIGNVAY